MQEITLFHLSSCPYCKRALQYLEELQAENPVYAQIPITMIEESQQAALADSYDYYYVPTFYIDEVKVHEGVVTKEIVKDILQQATNK